MNPLSSRLVLDLPDWLPGFLAARSAGLATPAQRMSLAIALSRENVERGTGGPFGAVVCERDGGPGGGRVLAGAVNCVVRGHCSSAHAELLALSLAQRVLGSWDLAAPGQPVLELHTSAQPCAMCTGAIAWAGVRHVHFGARAADVEALAGFDEGPLHPQWQQELAARGIGVTGDVLRDEACAVLRRYRELGGVVYNAGRQP